MENYPAVPSLASDALLLSPWQRLAFVANCCERMIPNYRHFSAQTSFGDVNVLRNALNLVWLQVLGSEENLDLASLPELCEAQAPDPSEFTSIYASSALDAATAVSLAASAAATQTDVSVVMSVTELARDTVDLYVQMAEDLDPNAPGFEAKILSSGLMQVELKRQRCALQLLKATGAGDRAARLNIVEQWKGVEVSSLAAIPSP